MLMVFGVVQTATSMINSQTISILAPLLLSTYSVNPSPKSYFKIPCVPIIVSAILTFRFLNYNGECIINLSFVRIYPTPPHKLDATQYSLVLFFIDLD